MFRKEKITQWFTNGKILLATIAQENFPYQEKTLIRLPELI
jgi:hypothetical protein